MIIFDLDGTLADCEHRRHFVDSTNVPILGVGETFDYKDLWKPDWQAFYQTCDKDKIISPTRCLFDFTGMNGHFHNIQIWSGRCESVREKTEAWLKNYSFAYACHQFDIILKMRPIGDFTPDEQLKERWLDEAIAEGKTIDFVFDDRPKVVRMWRRRGIFVFDCNQTGKEF
jgi:hypothetical protein